MRATAARQPRYLIGVASWGVLLTITLVGVALTIGLVGIGIAGEDRLGGDRVTFLIAAVATLVAGGGACVMAGAALSYQARPSPRPPVGDAVVWRPPFVYRAGVFVSLVGLSAAAVAIATLGLRPGFLLPAVAVLLVLWFAGSRVLIGRLEADRSGIRNTNPLTTVRFAWGDVRALEARGGSFLTERIVVVTEDGPERILWMWDPRVPMTRDAARIVVAELEAVRQLAAVPRVNGVD